MATDARGHTVPAASDHPQRADLLGLSLTTNGLTTVADTTARTAYVAALAAASPAQTVSTTKPAFVYRTDSDTIETSTDGTNWYVVPKMLEQAYTVVWSAVTTNPTLGNGTLTGFYTVVGDWVAFRIALTIGSTTTVGSGNYTFSVPVSPLPITGPRQIVWGVYLDASAANVYTFPAQVIGGSSTLNLLSLAFPVGSFSAVAPAVPAVGDTYAVSGWYRHA